MLRRLRAGIPKGFLGNVGWQTGGSILILLATFAYSIVVGRGLGLNDFGLLSKGLALATVVFQVVELRLQEAVVKFVAEFLAQDDAARVLATVRASLVADVVSGLLAFALTIAIGFALRGVLFDDPRASWIIVLSATYLFFNNVAKATSSGVLRILGHYKELTAWALVSSVARLAITTAALTLFHWGVVGVVAISMGVSLVTNAAIADAARRALKGRFPGRRRTEVRLLAEHAAEMKRFVRHLYFVNLTQLPLMDLDVTLLGVFSTNESVAVYRVARNFFTAAYAVIDPVYYTVYPELAKLWATGKRAEMRAFLRKISLMLGVVGVAGFVLSFLLMPLLVRWTFGPTYAESASVFRWLIPGLLVWAPLVWVPSLLLSAGRSDLSLRAGVISAAILLALYGVLIPLAGARGAAIVYGPGGVIVVLISLWFCHRAKLLSAEEAPS